MTKSDVPLLLFRHMKIHEKDPASGLLAVSPPSPTKRRRPSVKRRLEEETGEEPACKKVNTLTTFLLHRCLVLRRDE